MNKAYRIIVLFWVCGLLAGTCRADTFHLTDGQTISGDLISMDGSGFVLKQADGSYGERTPWVKLAQADLKELSQNPKAAPFVEPFLDPDPTERLKKTEVQVKDVARLPRPVGHSFLGAMFTAPLGLFMILVVYAGNLYAAYEISVFRAQPPGLVCGIAAAAPVIGPIIFLAMPTNLKMKDHSAPTGAEQQQLDAGVAAAIAADEAATAELVATEATATAAPAAEAPAAAPAKPQGKTFVRGQFTFNRRFFETQVPAFFAMTRPEAEKDKVLVVKANRGQYVAQRISRISANDMHLQVVKGHASEEVVVPFVEIQEVQLKHKDA